MIDKDYRGAIHLSSLPVGAKIALTAFIALIGTGYLVALANIYLHHSDADLEPGLGLNDLRRVYHGLEKPVGADAAAKPKPHMLAQVEPGGKMRKYLEKGGEEAVRALITWLERGAKEADFGQEGIAQPGDPSPRDVIAETCVRCHNSKDGEKSDVPYAESRDAAPTYAMVSREALPTAGAMVEAGAGGAATRYLPPMGIADLVQVTHVHIISIPVFALIIAGLFLLTGQSPRVKAFLCPLPMLAVCLDICSWWLARPIEPFVFAIGAAGALFGSALGLQMLCILGALWLGRSSGPADGVGQ